MKKILYLISLILCLQASAQIDSIPNPSGFSSVQLRKNILRVAPDDHIWVGFKLIGAGEYDGATWTLYNNSTGWPITSANAFEFDGSIKWIGTDSGLVKIDGAMFSRYDVLNSPLPSNLINDLLIDNTTLWIATDAGVVSFDGINWTVYNTSNSNLSSNMILSFAKNNFGLYASTTTDVFQFRSNNWSFIGTGNSTSYNLQTDASGQLFYGNYYIDDTLFYIKNINIDPCILDIVLAIPDQFFGGTVPNHSYIAINLNSGGQFYVLELDSQLNNTNIFGDNDQLFYDALFINQTNFKLYDFNSSGEFIKSAVFGNTNIYKTNFSGLNPLQPPASCPYLDINQVRARIWNNGSMFWDLGGSPLYEVPKGSAKCAIFSEGLWIGGRDSQDKIHIAAQTYRQSGSDFWSGPLDTITATIDSSTHQAFDKLWKIEKYTVNDFILNYQNGNVTNGTYTIPDIILNWPAHGSGNITRSLAPFFDNNLDGNYNPMDGDYPSMKGDQMFWWVFNDNFGSHGETGSQYNLGVEVHGSAYAYNCPNVNTSDSVINYTTFYHYDFYNRSDTAYNQVYIGVNTDVDIGYYLDDYVGCDTINDIAFAYNGDDYDTTYYPVGYGEHPPMLNLALLDGPEASPNDAIDNNHNGTIDEAGEHCLMNYFINWNNDFTLTGNPTTTKSYYWRMQALWSDSSHLTVPGTTDLTNYIYSGTPYDSINGWSESHPCDTCNPNEPGDRRFLVSSGPFDFPSHSKRSLDYAYVYTREPNFPNGPTTSLVVNHDQVMRIKHFFETDSFPCVHLVGIDEVKKEELEFRIYPVPAHSEINVSVLKDVPGEKFYYVTDVLGQTVINSTKYFSRTFKVDVKSFKPGIYFLHLKSKTAINAKKFIVE